MECAGPGYCVGRNGLVVAMIAHLPFAVVVVLAVAVGVLWRRTVVRRPVQVYVGLDEAAPHKGGARAARTDAVHRKRAGAYPYRDRGTIAEGALAWGRSQQPRLTSPKVAALPLHFRLLRRLGIECRMR